MIYREHYIESIRDFYDSDLIKIITGIRRCGKSIVLEQIQEEIKKKTDNVIYLNFEEKRTRNLFPTADALIKYVEEKRNDGKCYVFLDEVQVLDDKSEAKRS